MYRANKPQGGCQNTISKQVSFQEQINKTWILSSSYEHVNNDWYNTYSLLAIHLIIHAICIQQCNLSSRQKYESSIIINQHGQRNQAEPPLLQLCALINIVVTIKIYAIFICLHFWIMLWFKFLALQNHHHKQQKTWLY